MKGTRILGSLLLSILLNGCAAANNQDRDMISKEDATQIALNHAELTSEQVSFIRSELDNDDGRQYYDVEFYTDNMDEYDYEIDPYTGEVLNYDFDAEHY